MTGRQRLVTVLVTVSVPDVADPADAAALLALAAETTGLDVVHTTAVEGHLPVPGSTVLRGRRPRPWIVHSIHQDTATITEVYSLAYGQDVLGAGNTDSQLSRMHKVSTPGAGDLVFYGKIQSGHYVTHHVGVFIGNGQMIDALKTGTHVEVDNVNIMSDVAGYWRY